MAALQVIEPLLVMGLGMGLRISPDSRFELIIVGQGLSKFIGFVVLLARNQKGGKTMARFPPLKR
jgi:hypothetical protein